MLQEYILMSVLCSSSTDQGTSKYLQIKINQSYTGHP